MQNFFCSIAALLAALDHLEADPHRDAAIAARRLAGVGPRQGLGGADAARRNLAGRDPQLDEEPARRLGPLDAQQPVALVRAALVGAAGELEPGAVAERARFPPQAEVGLGQAAKDRLRLIVEGG